MALLSALKPAPQSLGITSYQKKSTVHISFDRWPRSLARTRRWHSRRQKVRVSVVVLGISGFKDYIYAFFPELLPSSHAMEFYV